MRRRRIVCGSGALALVLGCVLEPNPDFDGDETETAVGDTEASDGSGSTSGPAPAVCDASAFSFAVISDNDDGQDVSLARALEEIASRDDVHLIFGAGDVTPLGRLRTTADGTPWDGRCEMSTLPVFPAVGHADVAVESDMQWWADAWATGWVDAALEAPLATQLPGVEGFVRGPVSVQTESGFAPIPHGTIYAFDYGDARFTVVNTYLHEGGDFQAGVWDETGASVDEPSASQLDWVAADAAASDQPLRFVIGHVALVAPCYNFDPPDDAYPCPGPPPPGWSEHNSTFVTEGLTGVLSAHDVTAYFHGHDEVPSRMLLDGAQNVLFERKYWDVANDPNGAQGDPSQWQSQLGPGRLWQVDPGGVDDAIGGYAIVTIQPDQITFELWRFAGDAPTQLWDTWTISRP